MKKFIAILAVAFMLGGAAAYFTGVVDAWPCRIDECKEDCEGRGFFCQEKCYDLLPRSCFQNWTPLCSLMYQECDTCCQAVEDACKSSCMSDPCHNPQDNGWDFCNP